MVIINPQLSQLLVDDVLTQGHTSMLLPLLAEMCAVMLAVSLMRYGMIMCLEWSSQHAFLQTRQRIMDKMLSQDMHFYDRNRSGDLMTRCTGDMEYLRFVLAFDSYNFTDIIVMLPVAIIFLSSKSGALTLCMVAVIPILATASIFYSKKVRPLYANLRERLSDLNTAAQENISGNRVVRAFAREDHEIEKFAQRNAAYRKSNLRTVWAWQMFWPIAEFLAQSLTVLAVLVGGLFIINGRLTYGELMAFTGLTWVLANPLRNIGPLLNDLQRFFASSDKLMEIDFAQPSIVDAPAAEQTDAPISGAVRFEDVTFAFDRKVVLDHVSFEVNAGETVAVMGPTGSGKTTLISLISRFYDPASGRITMDGHSLKSFPLARLRRAIGVATQDVFLFSDTVDGNIAYSDPDMPEDIVLRSALAADADGFIREMSEGYDTIVGERGVGLSGGQRQRVALARALACRPRILILDDTTSAVDTETEKIIQRNLASLDFPCTVFIIAQRISSVRDADRIFILGGGGILEGTHDTLSRVPGYYRDVCELQHVPDLPALALENAVHSVGGNANGAQ